MPRTILFFGDSNTRGAGVGVPARFATLLEGSVAGLTNPPWQFALAHSESDLGIYPGRLDAALAKHLPSIVVLQCPSGPATFWINYPPWVRRLNALPNASFRWILERYIRAAVERRPEGHRTRRVALYESLYLDAAYRWNISQWFPARQIRRWCTTRYGTTRKTTPERYVELIGRLRDQIRLSQSQAKILFLGLLPQSEDYYPAYPQRAAEWSAKLAAALDRPDEGVLYLELHSYLLRDGGRDVLLSDGRHLTAGAHRRIAEAVTPVLQRLMSDIDNSPSV